MPDSYPLVVRRLASLDIKTAALWYEERIQGLGVKFVAEIDACLETILVNPELYPVVHRDIRRALVRRFPFAVFYVFRDETVIVTACMHTRRAPTAWRRRR
ncbi:MAG: type II toxin-antitoxin system RelE/ParE family toxin [Gemmatimonadota bacterium]